MLVIFLVLLTLALPVFLYGTFYVARGILRTAGWDETSLYYDPLQPKNVARKHSNVLGEYGDEA